MVPTETDFLMTMDHGTFNIDVGDSINIQRTDGECKK